MMMQRNRNSEFLTGGLALLGGAVLGASAALLLAPQSGRRTRRMLREKAEGAAGTITDTGREWSERGKLAVKDAARMMDRAAQVFSCSRESPAPAEKV